MSRNILQTLFCYLLSPSCGVNLTSKLAEIQYSICAYFFPMWMMIKHVSRLRQVKGSRPEFGVMRSHAFSTIFWQMKECFNSGIFFFCRPFGSQRCIKSLRQVDQSKQSPYATHYHYSVVDCIA